jgi:muconolactone D-isomerase
MEFLVTLRQDWQALRERADLAELIAAERRVGRELIAEGTLVRIWRLPGGRANVGVWRAADATQLLELLARLPLRAWMDAEVVPLAAHELEQELP